MVAFKVQSKKKTREEEMKERETKEALTFLSKKLNDGILKPSQVSYDLLFFKDIAKVINGLSSLRGLKSEQVKLVYSVFSQLFSGKLEYNEFLSFVKLFTMGFVEKFADISYSGEHLENVVSFSKFDPVQVSGLAEKYLLDDIRKSISPDTSFETEETEKKESNDDTKPVSYGDETIKIKS